MSNEQFNSKTLESSATDSGNHCLAANLGPSSKSIGEYEYWAGAVVRLHHFGAANEAVSPDGIRDAITGELVHVVNDSYTLATANDPKPTPSDIQGIYPLELRKMISLSNARSDYFAGHHAGIKYEIATGRRFELSALRN